MDLKKIAKLLGAAGGRASASKLTKDERKARGKHAAKARWAKNPQITIKFVQIGEAKP